MSYFIYLNNEFFSKFYFNSEFCITSTSILLIIFIYIILRKYFFFTKNKKKSDSKDILSLMKNTPIIYIKSLSKLTGFDIYAKCEYFSYYTSKDRIIKRILLDGINKGKINKNTMIYEASKGLSGYSLSSICQLMGYNSTLVIPDSCPKNLIQKLQKTKCKLVTTKNVDFSNFSYNYIRLCKRLSSDQNNSFYIDLYQNELNFSTIFEETAPEFYAQLNKKFDAFVCCADTGGTISGFSNFLKIKNKNCFIALADLEGSAINSYIKEGVLFRQERKEENEKIINDNYSTGNCFLNNNLRKANVDECYLCNENEVMFIINYIKQNDGIDIGFNEGLNLVGILKMIKDKKNILPKNANITTIFFDNGTYDCENVKNYQFENNPIKNIEEIY